jgi:hypothetical protein
MRGVAAASLILAAGVCGCATWDRITGKQPDTAGNGDERYDETSSPEKPRPVIKDPSQCGAEGKGDVVLLDARTSLPVSCVLVTLFREPTNCGDTECTAESIFQGRSNSQGLILVGQPIGSSRVYAVAEGYAQSYRQPGGMSASRIAEIEMVPDDGFLLKVLDSDGNYLPGVEVTFKQGEDVLAQMRTNDLANVYFSSRTPFSGESVTIHAEGYAPVTVASPSELGSDGHTLTVRH